MRIQTPSLFNLMPKIKPALITLSRRTFVGCLLALLSSAVTKGQEQPILHHRWEVDPDLKAPWVYVAPQPPITIDSARFTSVLRQQRLDEARKTIQHASNPTLQGREEALQAILSKLETSDDSLEVQQSIVSAALKLADSSHASVLWERLNQHDASRLLLEPKLIEWKSPVALEAWRNRLNHSDFQRSELIIAVRGIAAVGTEQDVAALESLLRSDKANTALKVVVAGAMGSLSKLDLEPLAEQITASGIEQHGLIAAKLLSHHSSDTARQKLVDLLNSSDAATRVCAYEGIARNFNELARELAPKMLQESDNNLRQQAIEVLNRFDDAESILVQSTALGDTNRQIRNITRQNLEQKARQADVKSIVDEVITFQLTKGSPPAIAQVILLSVALEERERCRDLVTLLDHPDPDTYLTAAWGLQALAESPEILELILEQTGKLNERLYKRENVTKSEVLRQAFLFEALGRNSYQPAMDQLRRYIKKNDEKVADTARASAIWAIGKINAGSKDSALAERLAQRMLDASSDNPEDPLVQVMSTIALGWIQAPESMEDLQKANGAPGEAIMLAREWALSQLSVAK